MTVRRLHLISAVLFSLFVVNVALIKKCFQINFKTYRDSIAPQSAPNYRNIFSFRKYPIVSNTLRPHSVYQYCSLHESAPQNRAKGPIETILKIWFLVWNWLSKKVSLSSQNISVNKGRMNLPYTIYINRKSGGKDGKSLLRILNRLVNTANVCDLGLESPSKKLSKMPLSHESNNSVAIACGGDGTALWIMDEAMNLGVSNRTVYGILPMGTGNDLFRHIVNTYTSQNSEQKDRIMNAVSTKGLLYNTESALDLYRPPLLVESFDRWQIDITRVKTKTKLPWNAMKSKSDLSNSLISQVQEKHRVIKFNNYFGIGTDGDITATYDSLRKQRPGLFFHRIVNKTWFCIIWIYKLFRGYKKNLSRDMELYCDGKLIDTTEHSLRGIILANICSYAGGSKLWSFDNLPWKKQDSDDGVIEVVGIKGLAHLASVLAGISRPVPIAQAKEVKMICKTRLPMQVDGEPWIQRPCTIHIKPLERVKIAIPSAK